MSVVLRARGAVAALLQRAFDALYSLSFSTPTVLTDRRRFLPARRAKTHPVTPALLVRHDVPNSMLPVKDDQFVSPALRLSKELVERTTSAFLAKSLTPLPNSSTDLKGPYSLLSVVPVFDNQQPATSPHPTPVSSEPSPQSPSLLDTFDANPTAVPNYRTVVLLDQQRTPPRSEREIAFKLSREKGRSTLDMGKRTVSVEMGLMSREELEAQSEHKSLDDVVNAKSSRFWNRFSVDEAKEKTRAFLDNSHIKVTVSARIFRPR